LYRPDRWAIIGAGCIVRAQSGVGCVFTGGVCDAAALWGTGSRDV
jgi:hypothetical protein